jgi:hypothetical protein
VFKNKDGYTKSVFVLVDNNGDLVLNNQGSATIRFDRYALGKNYHPEPRNVRLATEAEAACADYAPYITEEVVSRLRMCTISHTSLLRTLIRKNTCT